MSNTAQPSVLPPKEQNSSRNTSQTQASGMYCSNSTPDVFGHIEIDFKNTTKAGFDSFLRLFLPRCLAGDNQNKFDKIQSEIEDLQAGRFDKDRHHKVWPYKVKTGRPIRSLLDEALHQSLENVLKIANDNGIREMLEKFADRITDGSLVTLRCESYAELYNTALDRLGDMNDDCLRPPDIHGLRLKHANPNLNIIEATDVPDLVYTFASAARTTLHKGDKGMPQENDDKMNTGTEPTAAFAWPQVLSCEVTKAFRHGISDRARDILTKRQPFTGQETDPRLEYPFASSATSHSILEEVNSVLKSVRSEANDDNPTSSKRARVLAIGTTTGSATGINSRVQMDGYAMEMLSYGPGVVHVVNTLIINEFLYVWHYDRQGILCADAISIIADFPRFLVLLLAFQRFTVEDWGIVPCHLNRQGLMHLGIKEETELDMLHVEFSQHGNTFSAPPYVSQDFQGPLVINLVEYLSDQPHRLSGRMTSVLKASNSRKALACKISSPRIDWIPEGDVLRTVEAITAKRASEMLKHPPKHRFSGDLRAVSTPRPRIIFGIDGKAHCIPRVMMMNELAPLASLTDGKSFVKAWLDIVTCHAFLWKHGIEHGDPSLWNAMVDPVSKCGVLTDFDLTVVAWLDRVSGSDQTRTIPFMSLDLLSDKYWDGKVSRHYYHELEAFLWILPVVFLACDQGNLNLRNELIKDWFTSDYNACRRQKRDFLYETPIHIYDLVHGNFKEFAFLMLRLCMLIKIQHSWRSEEKDKLSLLPGAKAYGGDASYIKHSEAMWDAFIRVLSNSGIDVDISKPQSPKPIFDIALIFG